MTPFAFVFPGQGSQAVGMLDGWQGHAAVAQTLAEASDALGEDVAKLIHEGPKEALALTTNTQPVMLVAGVAAWRVWRAEGGAVPSAVAGHSLGEYSALVAAGVRGIVVAGTGNATVHEGMEAALQRARDKGVWIWRGTRCAEGLPVASGLGTNPAEADLAQLPVAKARIAMMLALAAQPRD